LNDIETIFAASEFEEQYKLFFGDALIVAAACNANAEKILTEDLNQGQRIEGVFIEKPFSLG
jgi:predicted nucleic acid-binding protein